LVKTTRGIDQKAMTPKPSVAINHGDDDDDDDILLAS
jgi:hypothetical protein